MVFERHAWVSIICYFVMQIIKKESSELARTTNEQLY